jgi:hypothetical protein
VVGMTRSCADAFPGKVGGIQVLEGLASDKSNSMIRICELKILGKK